MTNYRPIPLLTVFSKVPEKVMYNRLSHHVQFGFRQGKSTDNASFKLNHEILLAKLHYFGIQGTVTNWFRSYLTNRKQKTEIKSFETFSSK
jgi:hypothetical protein